MDALEQSAAVQALALVLAENLSREELARASLLLTQLGTTLATIVALCRIWSPRNRSKMGPAPRSVCCVERLCVGY